MERRRKGPDTPFFAGETEVQSAVDKNTSRASTKRKSNKRQEEQDQSIVSATSVILIVAFFIGAGFLQHHYEESRSQDQLNLLGRFPSKLQGGSRAQVQPGSHMVQGENLQRSSLLTEQEDGSLEYDSDGTRYHMVFSTDCSPYQHWQSYLVYFSAMLVRQPGHVTRIASGCDEDETNKIKDWFQLHVAGMSKRFHLLLTPRFSSITNAAGQTTGDYKFFNKPFGLKYWMEHSPQLNYDETKHINDVPFPKNVQEDIVILIDPDMGLIRPITRDFSNDQQTVIAKRRLNHIVTRMVGPGKPAAQAYGFSAQWARFNMTEITGTPDSPAGKIGDNDKTLYYPVGPPYLSTVVDMYRIAIKWSEFVPKVHQQYPHLLAEMFAFCIAAAHLKLPHQLISSLMVSDVTAGVQLEGWALVDAIKADHVCATAKSLVVYPPPMVNIPQVVHMCQRYGLGTDWFFHKRQIPADSVYACESPLFVEPPDNLATMFDFKQLPPSYEQKHVETEEAGRMAFMLCYLYRLLNEALTFYKQNACREESPNYEKTLSLVHYMKTPKK